MSIGEVDGAEEYLLVNPLHAMGLSDGTIVVQNSLRDLFELRYYDPNGRHLRTVGRWGQGPFEFYRLLGLQRLRGDSILAIGDDERFAVFGPDGERVREGRLGILSVLPVYTSKSISDQLMVLFKGIGATMPDPGLQRGPELLLTYDFETRQVDTLTTILGRSTFYERKDRGVWTYASPFAVETFVAAGEGQFGVGEASQDEINAYRPGFREPVVTIRVETEPRDVTRADRRRTREAYSELYSGDLGRRWARYARSMSFPDEMPRFGQLEVDGLGNLWVQQYETP